MINETELKRMKPPSKGKIAFATLVALIVATLVLVAAILPAEYGKDPLGTGRLLGLLALSDAEGATADAAPATPAAADAPVPTATAGLKEGEIKTPAVLPGWNKNGAGLYQVDSREIALEPKQGMEFKYKMQKGDAMVYAWDSPVKIRFEFHGEPEGSPRGTYESYAIDDAAGVDKGSGSFVAPFTGIHGWWFDNISDSPITVRLTTAGFYTTGIEFRRKSRVDHKPKDVEVAKRK